MKKTIGLLLALCIIFTMLQMPASAVDEENSISPTYDFTEIDENLDSDGDGLPDYIEIYFETDEFCVDTDNDGVTDYIELCRTCTDPLVPDGNTDTDGDGLSNAQEGLLGTDPDDKDTDNDKISDYDEVYIYNTDPLSKNVMDSETEQQLETGIGGNTPSIAAAIIDPEMGVIDGGSDPFPTYEGIMYTPFDATEKDNVAYSSISYKFKPSWFNQSNSVYNQGIAIFSSIASTLAYYGNYITIGGDDLVTTGENAIEEWLEFHGFTKYWKCNLNIYPYDDCHMSEMHVACRSTTVNGVTKNLIAVVIRGTYDGLNEWQSNFDVGSTADFSLHDEWTNITNHRGFDITSNRLETRLQEYVNLYCNDSVNTFWITGHSRGGALANLLAAKRVSAGDNVFCYTFASPNTTTNSGAKSSTFNCIFNIVNQDDLVCRLPLTSWNFQRYGVDKESSIEESYADEWDILVWQQASYNSNLTSMENSVSEMEDISSSRDGCYTYRTDSSGAQSFSGTSAEQRDAVLEAQLLLYPENVDGYYHYVLSGNLVAYFADIYQMPAFFMQLLAAMQAGEITGGEFFLIDVAPYLAGAKHSLIWLANQLDDDTLHPHFCESYYLLATKIT